MVDNLYIFNFSVNMYKKLILNLFIIVVVVFILDFAIGRTLRYFYFKETSGLHYRTTYAMETTKADILVFGSSRANHHYVPEVFEDSLKMTFYNTGRDGNGIYYQTALLKTVLKRYTPKIIILDYSQSFEKREDAFDRTSSLLPYCRKHKEIRNIIALKSPLERIKLISEIYPFNSQIITIAIGNLKINKKRRPDNKGYVALNKEWQAEITSMDTTTAYKVDPVRLYLFREFIKIAKISGAKLFVIYSPIFLKFNKNQVIEICNDTCFCENIPFWDFSRDALFLENSRLFYDKSHLNHKGAIIFSNLIVEKIKLDSNINMP